MTANRFYVFYEEVILIKNLKRVLESAEKRFFFTTRIWSILLSQLYTLLVLSLLIITFILTSQSLQYLEDQFW